MKIKAAVLREVGKTYSIETLNLDPPKKNEVLIKYAYAGYCHTDLHFLKGEIPVQMPLVAGHEGAGIVEAVGPDVTSVRKGDHVGVTWMVACGHCYNCRRGKGNICLTSFTQHTKGMLFDGTTRITDKDGKPVGHGNFISCFSTYSVVPELAVVPIPKEFPLDQAALMGCCVPTGWGAVFNSANVQPGDRVAVYCVGGVGLNVVRAAAMRQADPIIAVDIEASKKDMALAFGATHFIDSSKEDPVPKIQKLTGGKKMDDGSIVGGGADYVFEVKGDPGAVIQAYWSTNIGGSVICVGITPHDETTNLPLFLLPLHQKSIKGNLYGAISTHDDIPRLVRIAMRDDLMLDKLITNRFKLDDINDVAAAMDKRQIKGRWVCEFD